MKFISNRLVLIIASLLLYACPHSLTPQMKAEMQIIYYLRDIHTDSLYHPGDFSQMTEMMPIKEGPTAEAKYKIVHTYTVDKETEERRGMFYIASDYKVVYVEDITISDSAK